MSGYLFTSVATARPAAVTNAVNGVQVWARTESVNLLAREPVTWPGFVVGTAEQDDREDGDIPVDGAWGLPVFGEMLGSVRDGLGLRGADAFAAFAKVGVVDSPAPVEMAADGVGDGFDLFAEQHGGDNRSETRCIPAEADA